MKSEEEEIAINIKEVLTNDDYGQDVQLEALNKLKKIFKPPDRIFSKVRLESILQIARVALKTKMPGEDFLFNYGINLVSCLQRDSTFVPEMVHQIEYVLKELKKLDENQADTVGSLLWTRLEEKSITDSSGALCLPKQAVEKMVLDWVDTAGDPRMDFPARIAAASRELFQSVTAILYEVLVRSCGHGKVLEVTWLFISKVMSVCGKEGKDFLGLYPKDCCRLVSLLMVDPELFPKNGEVTVNYVNSLLLEIFLREKCKVLILLSHYSAWISPFRKYLNETALL